MEREKLVKMLFSFLIFVLPIILSINILNIVFYGKEEIQIKIACISTTLLVSTLLFYYFSKNLIDYYYFIKDKKKMRIISYILLITSVIFPIISRSPRTVYLSVVIILILNIIFSSIIDRYLAMSYLPFIILTLSTHEIQFSAFLFLAILYTALKGFPFFERPKIKRATNVYLIISIILIIFNLYKELIIFSIVYLVFLSISVPVHPMSSYIMFSSKLYNILLMLVSLVGIIKDVNHFYSAFLFSMYSMIFISVSCYLLSLGRRGVTRISTNPFRVFVLNTFLLSCLTIILLGKFLYWEELYTFFSFYTTLYGFFWFYETWNIFFQEIPKK